MNETTCAKNGAEVGDLRASWSKISQRMSCAAPASDPEEAPASNSAKQLLCSQNRAQVEVLREELSKAGIATETRRNPMAEALGVTGIELWVKNDVDFPAATSLYAKVVGRAPGSSFESTFVEKAEASPAGAPGKEPEVKRANGRPAGLNGESSNRLSEQHAQDLEKAASRLEKQIEEMLEFQNELACQCGAVRGKMVELRRALADREAALTLENETRAAARDKQAEEICGLRKALDRVRSDREEAEAKLDCERTKREKAEKQLESDRDEFHRKFQSHEEALNKAHEKINLQSRLLQAHGAAVARLKKVTTAFELQKDEDQKSVSRLREELANERQTRIAAEQRAESMTAAQRSLRLPDLFFRHLSAKKTPGN